MLTSLLFLSVSMLSFFTPTEETWSEWHTNDCYPRIQYRYKYNRQSTVNPNQHNWNIELNSNYDDKVYVSYLFKLSSDTSTKTSKRISLYSGKRVKRTIICEATKGSGVELYLTKLRSGDSDSGPFIKCDANENGDRLLSKEFSKKLEKVSANLRPENEYFVEIISVIDDLTFELDQHPEMDISWSKNIGRKLIKLLEELSPDSCNKESCDRVKQHAKQISDGVRG